MLLIVTSTYGQEDLLLNYNEEIVPPACLAKFWNYFVKVLTSFLCAGLEPGQTYVHPAGRHSRDLHYRGTQTQHRTELHLHNTVSSHGSVCFSTGLTGICYIFIIDKDQINLNFRNKSL